MLVENTSEQETSTMTNDTSEEQEVVPAPPPSAFRLTEAEIVAMRTVDRWEHVEVNSDTPDILDSFDYRVITVPASAREQGINVGSFFELINASNYKYRMCGGNSIEWIDADTTTSTTDMNVERNVEGKLYTGRYYKFRNFEHLTESWSRSITVFIGINNEEHSICVTTAFIDLRDDEIRNQWNCVFLNDVWTMFTGCIGDAFANVRWHGGVRTTAFHIWVKELMDDRQS